MKVTIEGVEITLSEEQTQAIKNKLCGDKYPKSWEELGRISGYYTGRGSEIYPAVDIPVLSHNRNVWPTEEQAEASLALAQLLQLRKRYVGEWEPDCLNAYGAVYNFKNSPATVLSTATMSPLSFPSAEIANAFLSNHFDLIKTALPLL